MKTKHESSTLNPNLKKGNNYYYGTGGLRKNYKKAVECYALAAGQGCAKAQYNLANCYASGLGIPQDDEETLKWYRASAEGGYPRAQYMWGKINASGRGENYNLSEESNDEEAVKWFKKAADQGYAEAQWHLASFYRHNYGVDETLTQRERYEIAAKYYKMAAGQGHLEAKRELVETQYLLKHGLPEDDDCCEIPDDLEQNRKDTENNAVQPFSNSVFAKPSEQNQSFTKDPPSSSGFRPFSP